MFKPLTTYARALRKNQTNAEKSLWEILRGRRFYGYKFRRQHPISKKYILDFFCVETNLAIELDGIHHQIKEQKNYDEERTEELKLLGIKVIRFTNDEVLNNIEDVLKKILINSTN